MIAFVLKTLMGNDWPRAHSYNKSQWLANTLELSVNKSKMWTIQSKLKLCRYDANDLEFPVCPNVYKQLTYDICDLFIVCVCVRLLFVIVCAWWN